MTSYATETPPVQPAPALTFTEVLPATPGVKPAAIRWTPSLQRPGCGLLKIQGARRCGCEYLVAEYPTGWDGRAVRMAKVAGTPGSDATADGYDVFVARNGQDCRCDCKGFEQHGHCKHASAAAALVQNGWLDMHLVNPDADTGPTEPPEDQPEPKPTRPRRTRVARAEAPF